MRPPVIAIVLRGYNDRFGFQKLYLRYAWRYRTNYLVLPWKLRAKDWDAAGQSVKPRAILGGETAIIVNNHLRTTLTKAYSIVADLIARDIPPTFDVFSQKMGSGKKTDPLFSDTAFQILKEEYAANEISNKTFVTYRCAVRKFLGAVGPLRLQEMSRDKVLEFKRKMVAAGKENLANQYLRYLKIMYSRVLKHLEMDDQRKPFDRVDIKVVKMSEKKSLTVGEYTVFRNALFQAEPGSEAFETLRRFLIMCRGLRFSDTQHLRRDVHYFEFQEGDAWYRYFATNAQKTGSKEIVPISESEAPPATSMATRRISVSENKIPGVQQATPHTQSDTHRPGNHHPLRPPLHRRFHPEQRRNGHRRRQKNPRREKRPHRGDLCAKGY